MVYVKTFAALAVGATAVVLAGCSSASPTPATSSPSSASTPSSSTPDPTKVASVATSGFVVMPVTTPDITEVVLTMSGVAPLKVRVAYDAKGRIVVPVPGPKEPHWVMVTATSASRTYVSTVNVPITTAPKLMSVSLDRPADPLLGDWPYCLLMRYCELSFAVNAAAPGSVGAYMSYGKPEPRDRIGKMRVNNSFATIAFTMPADGSRYTFTAKGDLGWTWSTKIITIGDD